MMMMTIMNLKGRKANLFLPFCVCNRACYKSNNINKRMTIQLTFGGDPVPNTDSGSLFRFLCRCRIEHFTRFFSISHTVTKSSAAVHVTWRKDWRRQGSESRKFWEWSSGHPDPDQSGNPDLNPGSLLVEVAAKWLALAEVCCLREYLVFSRMSRSRDHNK